MKKFALVVLVVTILMVSQVFATAHFSDLEKEHWAYQPIQEMVEKGILNGYPDGTFKPGNSVTRAEFAKILVLTLHLPDATDTITMKDVTKAHWAYDYIQSAKSYLTGFTNGSTILYMPDSPAVREDMAVAIVKAAGLQDVEYHLNTLNRFSDKKEISEDIKPYVAIAVENELMRGNADGTFNPKGYLTRAEVTQLMHNTVKALDKIVFVDLTPTPTEMPVVTPTQTPTTVPELTPTVTPTPVPTTIVPQPTNEPVDEPSTTPVPTPTKVISPTKTATPIPSPTKVLPSATPTATPTPKPTSVKPIYGDANGDKKVTEEDAILLLRHTLNPKRYPVEENNCDVNNDQVVDSDDAIVIKCYVAGIIEELPYTGEIPVLGDANGDKKVTSDDAILLLRHTLNPQRYQVVEANCDVNIDKAIDSDDAIIIKYYVDGIIEELPYTGKIPVLGDANDDGNVTDEDAILLLRHTLNPSRYPVKEGVCDLNLDGVIDSDDAIVIQKYVDGTINELPYVD